MRRPLIGAVGIGVYTGVRKVNCHTKGCWRIGHHPLDGTPYILCRHHHPDVPTRVLRMSTSSSSTGNTRKLKRLERLLAGRAANADYGVASNGLLRKLRIAPLPALEAPAGTGVIHSETQLTLGPIDCLSVERLENWAQEVVPLSVEV